MTGVLWQGRWWVRLRIVTGLILFIYAFFHFINIGLGLFSVEAMDEFQEIRHAITRNWLGTALLYGSLIIHLGIALTDLAMRRSFRMRWPEAFQITLGLLIPMQLLSHIHHTRYAHDVHDVNDKMSYLIILMWNNTAVWWQSALLLVVWIHGCMGLHFWLRLTRWWQRLIPYMIGLAVLIPGFALAGLLTEGRNIWAAFADPDLREMAIAYFNWPSADAFADIVAKKQTMQAVFLGLSAIAAIVFLTRKLLRRRRSVRVRYVDGPEITSERGMTLLEMSRSNGVPHTALCGGKGRCTTCRVVIESGAHLLHPPQEAERRSLAAVKAAPNTRLACQIRPVTPLTVFRVFRPEGGRNRAHASQGQEQKLAVLFLDMRGFTARTTGQLPYDVVFFLNRFFDAIVPAIVEAGGAVDKFLGDGLLAVFEAPTAEQSASSGLKAAEEIGKALEGFNAQLRKHGDPVVKIGMALHLGDLVMGEIGSSENAPRTIIGDTVNAASRLEVETKTLGIELLVSEPVLTAAGLRAKNGAMQRFTLRGVAHPIHALPVASSAQLAALLKRLDPGVNRG